MIKVTFAIALIFTSAGAWLVLDCLNKQELGANEAIHMDIEQARAEAKKRLSVRSDFENQIRINLTHCQAAAEKAKTAYVTLMQENLPNKRGQISSQQNFKDGVEKIFTSSQAECQQVYDKQVKEGY